MRALSPLLLTLFAFACAEQETPAELDEGSTPPSPQDAQITPDVYSPPLDAEVEDVGFPPPRYDVGPLDAAPYDVAPLSDVAPLIDAAELEDMDLQPDVAVDAGPQPDQGLPDELNCVEIIDCISACGDDDPCAQACYLTGSEEAQEAFISAINCTNQTGCAQTNDCNVQCRAPYEACFNGDGLTCEGIYDCFAGCAEGDQICLDNCYNSATPGAQSQYNNLVACFQVTDCRAQDNCEVICAGELEGCFGPQ